MKIEENLEERIGQILFKFPFVKPDDLRCRKVDCDNLKGKPLVVRFVILCVVPWGAFLIVFLPIFFLYLQTW